MPTYLSPGVYVEEIPSSIAPIAGVGTSTAGFIGVITQFPTNVQTDSNSNKEFYSILGQAVTEDAGDASKVNKSTWNFKLSRKPAPNTFGGSTYPCTVSVGTTDTVTDFSIQPDSTPESKDFVLKYTGSSLSQTGKVSVTYRPLDLEQSAQAGEVKLCTNFGEFKKFFGDFTPTVASKYTTQNTLAHAVYGFFNNGGTRCYVVWVNQESDISTVLTNFEDIDEIAIVAAPGITSKRQDIADHCAKMHDRVAILDGDSTFNLSSPSKPFTSDYAAFYVPWIKVFDPPTKQKTPTGDGLIAVPPSGHLAGIYARVDAQRGVHKAPANEPVLGALELVTPISKAYQDGLNPKGINCIRRLNGNIQVWGARTLADSSSEFKYISTRRLFNYLRKSIDEGTQWIVFEPNSPELWAKIRLNITAFLTMVWRTGALFGTTPEQAFFIKCDAENNPPESREQGQVVTEIGVAIVKPAEFVIFRISQWAGGSGS